MRLVPFFKITHYEIGMITGLLLLFIGMIGKVIAAILLIIKLLSKNSGSFLDQ